MRINKYLSDCGFGSRRACDKLIEEGSVTVNGRPAKMGMDIDEKKDSVSVGGKKAVYDDKFEYYILNKPKGYVTTVKDDKERKTVMQLLPKGVGNVVPVGRLDYDTEGLLLFTNDGDMHYRLTLPKNEIPKTYEAKIEGEIDEGLLAKLRGGVVIDGVRTKKCRITLLESTRDFSKVRLTITEGKNRQIRKMFETVGKNVVFLKRTHIGNLGVSGLDRGECRKLRPDEIEYLRFL